MIKRKTNKEINMNREPRRISPKLLARSQKRRTTKEVADLPKGSKEALRKELKGKIIPLSSSQPHSKTPRGK
jgi:hypothetical protein